MGDEPLLPSINLPDTNVLPAVIEMPRPILEIPTAKLPNYRPIVVPHNNLQPPPGVESEEEKKETQPEVRKIDIPIIDIPIPIPAPEILITAVTTAVTLSKSFSA